MPTKKIANLGRTVCKHPEHNPPRMRVFEPGLYEHECPACGHKVTFIVHETRCEGWRSKGRSDVTRTLRDELERLKANAKGRDYDAFDEGFKSALAWSLSKM